MIRYKYTKVTAASGAENETLIHTCRPGMRTILRSIAFNGADDVYITCKINDDQFVIVPSTYTMNMGNWIPVATELKENDKIYVGVVNESASDFTATIAIAFEEFAK